MLASPEGSLTNRVAEAVEDFVVIIASYLFCGVEARITAPASSGTAARRGQPLYWL
jgi:hypothetical protein